VFDSPLAEEAVVAVVSHFQDVCLW
jgi:hypothetical protein